jgi:hypothetical protein
MMGSFRPPRRVAALLGLALAAGSAPARAQVGNHWSEQYGNRSMLLGGAVIGSVSDLGLVFYNPGRLALLEEPAFVVTARAYEWQRAHMRDGLGEGVDLDQTDFGTAPSLAAGTFRLPFLGGPRMAYAFLTRQSERVDWSVRVERSGPLLDQYPGSDLFFGTANVYSNVDEEWVGLTWSAGLTEGWYLGVTTFYFDLRGSSRLALDLRALTEAGDVVELSRARSFGYRHHGVLWKAGLAGAVGGVDVGITVTTPRVGVSGSGRILYEDVGTGLISEDGAAVQDVLITNSQSGLPAETRSPWAVGAGVGLTRGRATVHLSGEWYAAVPRYTVTEARPFEGQSTGETVEYRVVEELESVVNAAVGIEWHRDENLSLFGSLASDRSAASRESASFWEDEASTTATRLDYPQVAGGLVISTSYFDLTFGAGYAWARDWVDRPASLPGEGDEPVFGTDDQARLQVTRWRFLFGFSFPFADRIRGAVTED